MKILSKNINFNISFNVINRVINTQYIHNKFKEVILDFKNKNLDEFNKMITIYKNKGFLNKSNEISDIDLINDLINILSIKDNIAKYKEKKQSGSGIINNTVLSLYPEIKPIMFFVSDLSTDNKIYSVNSSYVKVIFKILKSELLKDIEYFNLMLNKNYIDDIFSINEDEFQGEFLFINTDDYTIPEKKLTPIDVFNDINLIEKIKKLVNKEELTSWEEIEDYCKIELESDEYFYFLNKKSINIDEKIKNIYFDNNFNVYTLLEIL